MYNLKEEDIEKVSIEVFGTADYKAMLEILRPVDGMVRSFHRKFERLAHSKRKL